MRPSCLPPVAKTEDLNLPYACGARVKSLSCQGLGILWLLTITVAAAAAAGCIILYVYAAREKYNIVYTVILGHILFSDGADFDRLCSRKVKRKIV